jgi:hypothetical protein
MDNALREIQKREPPPTGVESLRPQESQVNRPENPSAALRSENGRRDRDRKLRSTVGTLWGLWAQMVSTDISR